MMTRHRVQFQLLKTFSYKKNILGLKVKTGSSLSFVIDKSTSMREEIKEVTKWTVDKVSSVIGTPMEPANYVLVTYSDPIKYTSAFVTKDGNEMVNKLQSIIVEGGLPDCPELTFSGLREAVELSIEGSTVICFTDGTSKDNELKEEVTTSAISKNITLKFMTFEPLCSKRKRSIQNYDTPRRSKRGVKSSIYEEVARKTGGIVYHVSTKTVGNALNKEFMENFPTSEVSVDFFELDSPKALSFYVDKNLLSFRVAITGKIDADEVYITSPSDMVTNGVDKNVSFRISNPSIVVRNLKSKIQISSGIIVSSATRHHAVNPGSEIEDYFTIRVNISSPDIIIYHIEVNPSESQEILQSLSGRLQVRNIQHPICQVVFKEGSCQNVTRSICSKQKWFAITETMFSGIRIFSVTLFKTGPHTSMTTGDIKAFYGPLQVNISGTCCESYNRLEILDTDDYLVICHLLFSSEVQLYIQHNVKEQESNIVLIVCISLGVLLVFILLTIGLVKFIKYRRKTFLVN